VLPVFRGVAAFRRAQCGRAKREGVLLLLEREKVIDPLDHKEALQKGESTGAGVEVLPVDEVEDVDVGPGVVLEEVGSVFGKTA
jgi:hypothetical protein